MADGRFSAFAAKLENLRNDQEIAVLPALKRAELDCTHADDNSTLIVLLETHAKFWEAVVSNAQANDPTATPENIVEQVRSPLGAPSGYSCFLSHLLKRFFQCSFSPFCERFY